MASSLVFRRLTRLALDRASARRLDHDGHLHVADNVLSAAVINPYLGSEIPGYRELGLKPSQVYQMLRDPDELAKAAASFDGKPLLIKHRPVTADDHMHEIVAGSVSNPVWDAARGQLRGDLSVWDGDAIKAIQDGSNAALSCGYYFDAEMTPGTYRGERYDGVMRNLKANHVSLVPEGRVAMAAVGDSAKLNLSKRRLKMATDDNGSDDARTKLLDFLASKLSGADLLQAIKIVDGVDDVDETVDPETAADRRRQVGDAKARYGTTRQQSRKSFDEMYPNAVKLKHH